MKCKQILALLLGAVCLLTYTGCSIDNPTETDLEETQPTETEEPDVYAPAEYLLTYADYTAAEKWRKENIEDTDIPPVYFEIDETDSTKLTWTKTVGEEYIVVSYEDTDAPAERTCQNIEYICAEKGLKLTVILTSYEGYPVVEYETRLINMGEGNSPEIKNVWTINAGIADYSGSITAHYNTGGIHEANAWEPHAQELTAETPLTLHPNYGLPTNDYIPYFNIEDTAEKDGVIAVLNWQGNWKADFTVADDQVVLCGGQHETDFAMLPEEELRLPGVVLLFYKDGDWQYGQNIWRRWMAEHNYMREIDERDFKESVYIPGDWSYGEGTESQIKAFAATGMAEKYNCIVNYDAVWYDPPGELWYWGQMLGAWTHVGHWLPKEMYANGYFKQISDVAKENGIGFSLWVEPERAVSDTKTALDLGDENMIYTKTVSEEYISASGYPGKRNVPYYTSLSEMLEKYGENPQSVGIVNYSRQEAVDYIIEMLDSLIKEHGVSVYRQDFNVNPADYWAAYDRYIRDQDGIPRTGITEMKYCEGYLTVWSTLAERHPDLVFDACAHGGRRLDLETLRYSFSQTKSDYIQHVLSQQGQNFGSSSWLLSTGGLFGGSYEGSTTYNTRSALSLNVCHTGWSNISASESILEEWHSLQKYMMKDYYQLSEYDITPEGSLTMQFSDYEAGEGMMIAYLRTGGKYDLKAKALDPQANYKVWDEDNPNYVRVMSGASLMEEGFTVSYPEGIAYAAVVWFAITDEEVTPFDPETYLKPFAVLDETQYEKETNDEEALVALYQASGVTGNQLAYLCADPDTSGGIYAVGSEFYAKIPTTEQKTADGWTWVDGSNLYFDLDCLYYYPLTTWPVGGTYDIRAYVKEIEGCYFLWMDNSFGFGDADASIIMGDHRLQTWYEGEAVTSEPFAFAICQATSVGNRDMQYVFADNKNNVVYQLTEKFYNRLKQSENTFAENGYTWTEIDYADMYLRIPHDRNQTNTNDDSLYGKVALQDFHTWYSMNIYLTEKDGSYYMWIQNADRMERYGASGRWEWYYLADNKLCFTTFYNSIPMNGVFVQENLVTMW